MTIPDEFVQLTYGQFYDIANSKAAAFGESSKARASENSAIVLCYRNDDGELIHIRCSKVGENGIKAGVWYTLDEAGEFVEAE